MLHLTFATFEGSFECRIFVYALVGSHAHAHMHMLLHCECQIGSLHNTVIVPQYQPIVENTAQQ